MEVAPGIKLGRTDTTLDLSRTAKEAGEKRLFGGEEGGVFILLESRQRWLGESGRGCLLGLIWVSQMGLLPCSSPY
jgi:hypothetical protein